MKKTPRSSSPPDWFIKMTKPAIQKILDDELDATYKAMPWYRKLKLRALWFFGRTPPRHNHEQRIAWMKGEKTS